MDTIDYWKECIGQAADDCDLKLTAEQLNCLADGARVGHEHYGMAFYTPGWGDRFADLKREGDDKLKQLQAEFDAYRTNAETAVKRALRQYDDAHVTIGKGGEVLRHDGRIVQIQ